MPQGLTVFLSPRELYSPGENTRVGCRRGLRSQLHNMDEEIIMTYIQYQIEVIPIEITSA